MKRLYFLSIVFAFIALSSKLSAAENTDIRYVAIGDSYSIGTGVSPQEAWPVLLTDHLRREGFNISLIANPSHNGWTSTDAQEWEMAILRKSSPTFATLMVGVNDWLQDSTPERFRDNFADLLDDMLSELPANKILVVNIPDFSATLKGSTFTPGRNISKGIAEFNRIIGQVCKEKAVMVVDIYTVSQKMRLDPSLTASDGLHPSQKGQLLFEQTIYPFAKQILIPNFAVQHQDEIQNLPSVVP